MADPDMESPPEKLDRDAEHARTVIVVFSLIMTSFGAILVIAALALKYSTEHGLG